MAKPLFAFLTAFGIITFFGIELAEACSCFPKDDPVCGEDGVTYKNECYLFCHNWDRIQQNKTEIKKKCHNTCECCDPKPCNCDRCYDPVCGENNVTYPNPCILNCENKKRKCQGLPIIEIRCKKACEDCPLPCCCNKKYEPVCGEDNVTYNNLCLLGCKNKQRKSQGLPIIGIRCKRHCKDCPLQKGCKCKCGLIYDPVCGMDGKTYTNQCWLDCINKWRKKKKLPHISIKCRTACRGCPPEVPCICPALFKPVCGSDGKTYSNICLLNCENKKRINKGLPKIHLCCNKDCKKCRKCKGCSCSKIYAPVCGTDNATYGNKCLFECERKYRIKHNMPKITLVCKRPCKECVSEKCNCPKLYRPVCGSNGKTYDNICLLDCENKKRHNQFLKPIKIRCNTECKHWAPSNGCICPAVYDPVCGTDGKTYSNHCWLTCTNRKRKKKRLPPIGIKCDDECIFCRKPKPCVCKPLYYPICGTDGKTYTNPCLLRCENEKRKKKGRPLIRICCKKQCKKCPQCIGCICPHIYSPICGSDGKTYLNICEFNCENKYRVKHGIPKITIRCQHSCDACLDEKCDCPNIYAPVCSTGGKTYKNICFLEYQNTIRYNLNLPRIEFKYRKACEDDQKPYNGCICPEIYDPVCGLDGKTYTNECWLKCKNRKRQSKGLSIIKIKCSNDCKYGHEHPHGSCQDIFDPVCGNNGRTYNNECLLTRENLKRKRMGLSEIRICCKNKCKDCPNCNGPACPSIYKPICGSNGKTYENICEFDRENKYRKDHGKPSIKIRCFRPCEECLNEKCPCPKERFPVCGTNGITYDNICFLEYENVKRHNRNLPRIEVKCYKKECKDCNPPNLDCICPHTYDPVCGLNGKTYSNHCWLDCTNRYRKKKGLPHIGIKCKDECKNCYKHNLCDCTAIYSPICGTDGKTYGNTCLLSYENKKRKTKGLPPINVCCNKDCKMCPGCTGCKCLPIYYPICGSDGYTYGNTCEFDHENKYREAHGIPKITIRCRRPCDLCLKDNCHLCQKMYKPVCGTDGNTYNNKCFLECENIKRFNQKLSPIKVKCEKSCKDCLHPKECDCTDKYEPICGLDGKTYTNMCWLKCINSKRNKLGLPPIGIKCKRACRACPPDNSCICPKVVTPVCGSNGVTYDNTCLLAFENKKRKEEGLPKIHECCKKDCKHCPACKGCPCPKIYDPVCGSDKATYGNMCLFKCENEYRKAHDLPKINLLCERACNECVSEVCGCPKKYSPVCGTDGKTYGNKCLLLCENKKRYNKKLPPIKIKCEKSCKDCLQPKECDCTDKYEPICGLDGKTYTNMCWLKCINSKRNKLGLLPIGIKCKRACRGCPPDNSCICPQVVTPVCGSNGVTYDNTCLLACENKKRKEEGLPKIHECCKKDCKHCPACKGCPCPKIYDPVCGSDKATYGSMCLFKCENEYRKAHDLPKINLLCERACNECVSEVCGCPKIYSPVCGTDGKTYGNKCLLLCENKKRYNKKLPPIKIKCEKSCKDCLQPKECDCTDKYEPICGLDGKTYTNMCWLKCINSKRNKLGLLPIGIKCKRACRGCPPDNSCICPQVVTPVCGSNGVTYDNTCLLACENKKRKEEGLPKIHECCKKDCKHCPACKGCPCPKIYDPVCGSDKATYGSMCLFKCENEYRKAHDLPKINLLCERACNECVSEVCGCPKIYSPVCGTDGKTYGNKCLLLCENKKRYNKKLPPIKIKCEKSCKDCLQPKECDCTDKYEPICGLDGKTYTNMCWLKCINSKRNKLGLPPIGIKCKRACRGCPPDNSCICPQVVTPVCGSNRVTYDNACHLACENKKRKEEGLPKIHECCKKDCKHCPACKGCPCPKIHDPVCGSDKATYGNMCIFKCENEYRKAHDLPKINLICERACNECVSEVCGCPKIYSPVCGTDGKTYGNKCLLLCENKKRYNKKLPPIKIKCEKSCKDCLQPKECDCTDKYEPICGLDGKTYTNMCWLKCINSKRNKLGLPPIGIKCKRACRGCPPDNSCICPKVVAPVCGSNGVTYDNTCLLAFENKKRKEEGLPKIHECCKKDCKHCPACKGCPCPKIYYPVCGSDEATYGNMCLFKCENEYRKAHGLPKINLICERACNECVSEVCGCPKIYSPVCGTDGKTYGNKCLLLCENKKRYNKKLPPIEIKCEKSCNNRLQSKECDCTDKYEPICGMDGKTYTNMCWLKCINSKRNKLGLPPIGIKCKRACRACPPDNSCICPKVVTPVCGSNGVTYDNTCLLACENKKRKEEGLPKIHECCKKDCKHCPVCKGCPCPKIYDPVCGSDKATYGNSCLFKCENEYRKTHGLPKINLICERACNECVSEVCRCPKMYSPVCGSDGKTYGNKCLLLCENKKRDKKKLPPIDVRCKRNCKVCEEEKKRCSCLFNLDPVCGSDNVTYSNYCQLDCENFHREQDGRPTITVRCKKSCDKCKKEVCNCTKIRSPVCGSDNKTYGNICLFEYENKKRCENSLKPLTIRCHHDCKVCDEEKKRCTCNYNLDPVCGSDNVTYSNYCHLDCENFHREQDGRPKLTLRCKRPCDRCKNVDNDCECKKIYSPVCGSDNQTYGNICILECKNKERYNNNLPPVNVHCKLDCKYCDEEKKRCSCDFKKNFAICGTDGVSYSNFCQLDCGNFHRKLKGLPPIDVVCTNVCDLCYDECECDDTNAPVCTTDGKTYRNRCEVGCANRLRADDGLPLLKIACESTCKACSIRMKQT